MRDLPRSAWRILPAVLAFSLLAAQIAIPWTVPHFVTQDGPSYLYSAMVAKSVLWHQQPYASLYAINPHLVPSWGSTILFVLIAALAGPSHVEAWAMGVMLCVGFFSLSYAIRSLSPAWMQFTPLSNFLLQTWFLWIGFYNFYLGMALVPLGIGFYIRRNGRLTVRAAIALGAGLTILFFVHLLAAAILGMVLVMLAIWLHFVLPALGFDAAADQRERQERPQQVVMLLAAITPVILLGLIYAHGATSGLVFHLNLLEAWYQFPMHAFATTGGFAGGQWYLWPAVLGLMVIAALGMLPAEWRTAKGGIAMAGLAVFLIYLIVPDSGLGGNQVKVRFVWVVFILGGLLVASAARLQPLRTPIAIFVAACLAFNLASTARTVSAYSRAVEDYLGALAAIRPGSNVIRVRFPTPAVPERYGYPQIGRDPLFHMDAYGAATGGYIDLSDYQPPTTDFPVVFNSTLDHEQQFNLLSLEHPSQDETANLDAILHQLPISIDYAIVVADASSSAEGVAKVAAELDSGMQVIAQSPAPPFVRVYRRIGAP